MLRLRADAIPPLRVSAIARENLCGRDTNRRQSKPQSTRPPRAAKSKSPAGVETSVADFAPARAVFLPRGVEAWNYYFGSIAPCFNSAASAICPSGRQRDVASGLIAAKAPNC